MAKTLCDCEFNAHWLLMGIGVVAEGVGKRDKQAISRDVGEALELVRDLEKCLGKDMPKTRASLAVVGESAAMDEWDKASSEAIYASMEVLRDTCK